MSHFFEDLGEPPAARNRLSQRTAERIVTRLMSGPDYSGLAKGAAAPETPELRQILETLRELISQEDAADGATSTPVAEAIDQAAPERHALSSLAASLIVVDLDQLSSLARPTAWSPELDKL